jgi:hypothetical protein
MVRSRGATDEVPLIRYPFSPLSENTNLAISPPLIYHNRNMVAAPLQSPKRPGKCWFVAPHGNLLLFRLSCAFPSLMERTPKHRCVRILDSQLATLRFTTSSHDTRAAETCSRLKRRVNTESKIVKLDVPDPVPFNKRRRTRSTILDQRGEESGWKIRPDEKVLGCDMKIIKKRKACQTCLTLLTLDFGSRPSID